LEDWKRCEAEHEVEMAGRTSTNWPIKKPRFDQVPELPKFLAFTLHTTLLQTLSIWLVRQAWMPTAYQSST
jgi:hypothetical protein